MQQTVHNYLKALEAGDANKAAALFIPDGWVESPFLGRLPVRQFVKKVADASNGTQAHGARRARQRGRSPAGGRLLSL